MFYLIISLLSILYNNPLGSIFHKMMIHYELPAMMQQEIFDKKNTKTFLGNGISGKIVGCTKKKQYFCSRIQIIL